MEKTTYKIEIIHRHDEDREIAIEEIFKQIAEGYTAGHDRAENGSYFQWSLQTEKL